MFSNRNITILFYVLFTILSFHRAYAFVEEKPTFDKEITEIPLLELPEAGELYEMVPQEIDESSSESLIMGDYLEAAPVYIHGVPFILKHKFYYHHKKWLPKSYIKGNFYKICFNHGKCKFIIIKQ
ncbi:hypothetical protein C1645_734652 [Glomus cerebriforme]|uniref:Uncharacterized protein n=1 Tax=Glomus cerebriforme TaxID=658196 RepID=A0A397TIK2_9GLOM|nr:hypothetical protein C1645_734652 [Glomus cerebriforme]